MGDYASKAWNRCGLLRMLRFSNSPITEIRFKSHEKFFRINIANLVKAYLVITILDKELYLRFMSFLTNVCYEHFTSTRVKEASFCPILFIFYFCQCRAHQFLVKISPLVFFLKPI